MNVARRPEKWQDNMFNHREGIGALGRPAAGRRTQMLVEEHGVVV